MIQEKFLEVIAIFYKKEKTDSTVLEANFSIWDDDADNAVTSAYDFLSFISDTDYSLEKFPVKDAKNYLYHTSLNKFSIATNIVDLLQYNQNKTFHEIVFRGWEVKELQKNINYILRQYNLSHINDPLFMQGVLNKTGSNVILKAYFGGKERDKNKILSLVA